jgi:protein-disulfide isomerase
MSHRILLVLITFFGVASAFFFGWKFYSEEKKENVDLVVKEDFKRLVPDDAPRLGTSHPLVYLVEFLDPECETCRVFYPLVKSLLEEFDGKVQLVVRYAPLHQNSKIAIKILEASRLQGKYWETMEILFKHQPEWGSHHDPKPELLWSYLPEAGLDVEKVREGVTDPELDQLIEREIQDGTHLGVQATPTFFVNGQELKNFSLEGLRDLIRSELEKASH